MCVCLCVCPCQLAIYMFAPENNKHQQQNARIDWIFYAENRLQNFKWFLSLIFVSCVLFFSILSLKMQVVFAVICHLFYKWKWKTGKIYIYIYILHMKIYWNINLVNAFVWQQIYSIHHSTYIDMTHVHNMLHFVAIVTNKNQIFVVLYTKLFRLFKLRNGRKSLACRKYKRKTL